MKPGNHTYFLTCALPSGFTFKEILAQGTKLVIGWEVFKPARPRKKLVGFIPLGYGSVQVFDLKSNVWAIEFSLAVRRNFHYESIIVKPQHPRK